MSKSTRGTRAARRMVRIAVALAVTFVGGACSDQRPSPGDTGEAVRANLDYIDVGAHLDKQVVLAGHRIHPTAWTIGGETRAVLRERSPSRVSLALESQSASPRVALRSNCRLRFAVAISDDAWAAGDGVRFRVWAPRPSGGAALLFEEALAPQRLGGPSWQDREVALPDFDGTLILETDAGRSGDHTAEEAGWGAPHVICEIPPIAERTALSHPHIILISLDTLRPDHLGAYGYPKETSPNLDALARESWVFENAFAVAPFTMPTHASMFTGLYPHQHGAGHVAPFAPLGPGPQTLAELLSEAGYRTVAFSAGGILSARNGFDRGFTEWTDRTRANLASVLPSVYASLGSVPDEPTFLFLHTYDIHGPYRSPGSVAKRPDEGAPRTSDSDETSDATSNTNKEWERIRRLPNHRYLQLDRFRNLSEVVDAYDAGIREVDRQLGGFFQRLKSIGIWNDAVIIVTSDHGESLYERDLYIGHSFTLFDEELRIPLILRLPGGLDGSHQLELVDQTDILPTLLDAAGLDTPGAVKAMSVAARVRGLAPPRLMVQGEASHTGSRFVRTRALKVIGSSRALESPSNRVPKALRDRFELGPQAFDVVADAAESQNIYHASAVPPEVDALMRRVEDQPQPGAVELERQEFSGEILQQLRALGYID